MSQQANITAFDGAATPVTHTLTTAGVSKDPTLGMIANWRELVSGVPNGAQPSLRMTQRVFKNGTERVSIDLKISVMESVAGQNAAGYTAAPKVAFTDQHSYVLYTSDRSTGVQRRLGRQWLTNIVNGIATTVTPVTTGNAAELIDSSILPG